MQVSNYEDMVRGWFVGNFEPSAFKTNDVEVAVQQYKKGDTENSHHHKIATEITFIMEGTAKINGIEYKSGDILVIEPNESVEFEALTDVKNVVVKVPGANDDKYED